MRADRAMQRCARVVCLLLALCALWAGGLVTASAAMADSRPGHSDVGPPDPFPKEWAEAGDTPGIDSDGKYCQLYMAGVEDCHPLEGGEMPGTIGICEGDDGRANPSCPEADRKKFELRQLEKWREKAKLEKGFDKRNTMITACVEKGGAFLDCSHKAYEKYPVETKGPLDWVAGKISELASDALQEAASYIGKAVVWLLEEFAKIFNSASTIKLNDTGIGKVWGIANALGVVIATFLLLFQWGKVSVSHQGEPAATAIVGLAKWAVISSVYWTATQAALGLADAISTWIINYSFTGGGSGDDAATEAMQRQLGTMFGGLITGGGGGAVIGGALISGEGVAASAVGVIIVIGIITIVAIAALWLEVLLRQAGIMILVATMPIVLAGQMSDSTADWWPKARNALIGLVLMKPAIVLTFSIGFFAMDEGRGIQNMLVGLVIFLLACIAWPVIAKFMTFTTAGGGSSMASGLLSTLGSSAGSSQGGYRSEPGGAGAVGGGSGYTRALERENSQTAAAPSPTGEQGGFASGARKAGARSFGAKVLGTVALPLQVAAAGKDALESGMANTAAHAGLDHGSPGGRHAVMSRRSAFPEPRGEQPGAPTPASEASRPTGAARPTEAPRPTETPPAPRPPASPPREGGPS
ncbi:hypothetical protein ACFC5T_40205 [Streptomyces sp. NPDC055961]|uniref:hypothetical protein n=1 Tax=Streptomyces sp. NPDC055961 TaxID=3345666 RepID=UPI0035D9446F